MRLAFHTESNSTLWYERDIDLFMPVAREAADPVAALRARPVVAREARHVE
ncbi:hypothetical protein [Streptomyces dysideae]|uniref:hypothetical protein n=1 Tax=Streptomyces dysideae TaxID=909626 RepID=UPI000A54F186|nr:hypothetical protein [Streptomyces dysideae]